MDASPKVNAPNILSGSVVDPSPRTADFSIRCKKAARPKSKQECWIVSPHVQLHVRS